MKQFSHKGLYNREVGYIQSTYTNKYKYPNYPKIQHEGYTITAKTLFTSIFEHQSSILRPFKYFYNRLFILELKCALFCEEEGLFQDPRVRKLL